MNAMKAALENRFRRAALLCYQHPVKVLVILLAGFALTLARVDRLTFDTSTESFFHATDPTLKNYQTFRDQFGRDDVIVIALKPQNLYTPPTLDKIRRLHEEISDRLSHVDDLTSIVNVRNVRGEGDRLIVEDLLETLPLDTETMKAFRRRVMSNPFFRDLIISADGSLTTIIIKLDTYDNAGQQGDDAIMSGFSENGVELADSGPVAAQTYLSDAEIEKILIDLRAILSRYADGSLEIFLAGTPVVDNAVKLMVARDMARFAGLSLAVIAGLLLLMFRRIAGVLIPLVIVVMSLGTMLGWMAWCRVPITIVTQILSSLVLVVGVGDAVHILAIFYRRLDRTGDRRRAIGDAVGHSGLAVAMTSLTTAGGLLSFATADIAPVADLGLFASIGVLSAFIYTVTLLPALIALWPIKKHPASKKGDGRLDRMLARTADFATGHPKSILLATALLVVASMAGISRLGFSHNILRWLPENLPIRQATQHIDDALNGSVSLEVVVDTGIPSGLYDHSFLTRLDTAAADIETMREGRVFAGKTWSLTSILKESHRALNENRPSHYRIPEDNALIAQEMLLFENSGSDDLEDVMDTQASRARLSIKSPFEDAIDYARLIPRVRNTMETAFPECTITISGIMALFARTIDNVMTSMAKSYVVAFGVITLLMFLFLNRPALGLLSMVPNLTPILMVLGFMGWKGIALNASNMLIGSIAIGLVVDDTIHFMHNFIRCFDSSKDVSAAVRETLQTTGHALLVTSLVLFCGFLTYGISAMKNIFQFGVLTATVIALALLADFLVAPALLAVWLRSRGNGRQQSSNHPRPPMAVSQRI